MRNELVTKEVRFNGDVLMVAQDNESKKIYVGVSWICSGIGLSKSQKDTQVQKLQSDIVLKMGCLKFQAGVFDLNNETLAVELEYLPLWLAKINITPSMIKESPDVANKLIQYQLKAKDALAREFIHNEDVEFQSFKIPTTLSEALQLSADLAKENESMKPKAEQFDLYLSTDNTLSMNKVAKQLKARRNKLMMFLRYKKVFNQDNSPSSYYSDKGYFVVNSYTVKTKDGRNFSIATTRVTPTGQDFLYRYMKKHKEEYMQFDSQYLNKMEVSTNA